MSLAVQPGTVLSTIASRTRCAILILQGPLLVSVCYFLGAELAFYIGTLSDRIFALFWPPNVILFFALLIASRERWGLYIAAVFPAHVIAEFSVGMPWPQICVAFATNCLVAFLNAHLVRRIVGDRPWFGKFHKAAWYIVITAGIAPAISALGGAFVPILGDGSLAQYGIYWSHWYFANAIPNITLGPAFLIWFSTGIARSSWRPSRDHIEPALLILALIVASVLAAGLQTTNSFLPALLLSPLPILLWAAFRFGERGASSALFVVAAILTWSTLHGLGPFNKDDAESSVLALQLFLMGLAVAVLLLGALVDELRGTAVTMQHLAASLVNAQDVERRRIARDLHDSTGQHLAAASMLVGRLEEKLPGAGQPMFQQLEELLQESSREIRAVSYLLHPPLLDEEGLSVALRVFIEGYAERSNIAISFDVTPNFGRLPADTELILFRVVQEALTNIARHSNSSTARVRLARRRSIDGHHAVLTIEDAGLGMPASGRKMRPPGAPYHPVSRQGVGLISMHERLTQIGGRLDIKSRIGQTVLTAVVPIPRTIGAVSGFA